MTASKLTFKNHEVLNDIIITIVQEFSPLHIYQFAEVTRKEQVGSLFSAQFRNKQHIFYLLVITENNAMVETTVQNLVDAKDLGVKVVIQLHCLETVLKSLKNCNGYFARIIGEGKLLYQSAGTECYDGLRLPNPKKRLGRAIVHWRKRKEMAEGFFAAAEQAIEVGHEHIGLFLLHHATEQACLGLIYVFMDYQSDVRNLERLLYLSACFSNSPFRHFLGTMENEVLLKIMMKSFSEARYDNGFSLAHHSIYRFSELVGGFLKLANGLCENQFKVLNAAVAQIKVMKGASKND